MTPRTSEHEGKVRYQANRGIKETVEEPQVIGTENATTNSRNSHLCFLFALRTVHCHA